MQEEKIGNKIPVLIFFSKSYKEKEKKLDKLSNT
jgi:hypothetical protein